MKIRPAGENGNWRIDNTETNISDPCPKGDKEDKGDQGEPGNEGKTPYIGENGIWWIEEGTPAYRPLTSPKPTKPPFPISSLVGPIAESAVRSSGVTEEPTARVVSILLPLPCSYQRKICNAKSIDKDLLETIVVNAVENVLSQDGFLKEASAVLAKNQLEFSPTVGHSSNKRMR